jgi:hypothetical protein
MEIYGLFEPPSDQPAKPRGFGQRSMFDYQTLPQHAELRRRFGESVDGAMQIPLLPDPSQPGSLMSMADYASSQAPPDGRGYASDFRNIATGKASQARPEARDLYSQGLRQAMSRQGFGPFDSQGQPFHYATAGSRAEWDKQYGANQARFMTTPEGGERIRQLAALAALQAFQNDGLEPEWAGQVPAGIYSAIQALRSPLNRDPLASARMRAVLGPDPLHRAFEGDYWFRRGNDEVDRAAAEGRPPRYKDPHEGAFAPEYSATTRSGVGRNFYNAGSNWWAAINQPFRELTRSPQDTMSQRSDTGVLARNLLAETPVIPDGMDPEQFREARNRLIQRNMSDDDRTVTAYPEIQSRLGMEPSYPPGIISALMMLPQEVFGDAGTAIPMAGLAGKAALSVARGAKTLPAAASHVARRAASELYSELPFEVGTMAAFMDPDDLIPGRTPEGGRRNEWVGQRSDGTYIQPKDPDYSAALQDAISRRDQDKEFFKEIADIYRNSQIKNNEARRWPSGPAPSRPVNLRGLLNQ